MDLLAALRSEGISPIEHPGWRTRERAGTFTPVGVMNHHTAAGGTADRPSLGVVADGRAGIPGPLCNILIGRKGSVTLISDGRANDSGRGSGVVLRETKKGIAPSGTANQRRLPDDTDGNAWFYDIEVENNGTGEPYSNATIEALIRVNVAICRWKGWTAERCIHHKEWTARKIDMSWAGALRPFIAQRLNQGRPQEVLPMFHPALDLEPIAGYTTLRSGDICGTVLVAPSGAVYAFPAELFKGGANGKAYFAGRTAARIQPSDKIGKLYKVVATSGEEYHYPEAG